MSKPKKCRIENDYVSAYDAERVRRAFEESKKSAEQISQEYGLPAEAVPYVANAAHEGYRVSIRPFLPRTKGGTAPNASLILTDDELAFIEEQFGGSKSAAIHAALAALQRSE